MIDTKNIQQKSIEDFVKQDYEISQKPILFWDTCAFLNILRFIYRNVKDPQKEINAILEISEKIGRGDVYSVCSSIEKTECVNNYDKTLSEFANSLKRTTKYHKDSILVINTLNKTSYSSESLVDKSLSENLHDIAQSIFSKTIFLTEDASIASDALNRTINNIPPAGVKKEFKDCAIWATMIRLAELTNKINPSLSKVFYTVNFEDFCEKNNPEKILHRLHSESISKSFALTINIMDTLARIAP